MTDSYDSFKKQIHLLTGVDLDSYKENQMKRRLDSLIERNGLKGYQDYICLLKSDKAKIGG